MASPIRVVLAEDHTIVREGVRALLEDRDDIEVVDEVADGRSAIESAVKHRPDVIVMDVGMPVINGVDATKKIREALPDTRVLMLSMYSNEEYVRPAIRAGANGYLLKGSGLSDLVQAIRSVATGDAFFSPEVAKVLLEDSREEQKPDPLAVLTKREREVLVHVAEGKSSPEIAKLLGLSVKTVEGHRGRIMAKLDIRNVAGLVRYAIKVGLIDAG